MNQAHEPKWGNLGNVVWRAPRRSPVEFPIEGSKIDTWLGVTQSTLGTLTLAVDYQDH